LFVANIYRDGRGSILFCTACTSEKEESTMWGQALGERWMAERRWKEWKGEGAELRRLGDGRGGKFQGGKPERAEDFRVPTPSEIRGEWVDWFK
jgi:hypothetical protein